LTARWKAALLLAPIENSEVVVATIASMLAGCDVPAGLMNCRHGLGGLAENRSVRPEA
jgi:hypothetical protein